MPLAVALLVTGAQPAGTAASVFGVILLTVIVLLFAAWRSRKLEINYAAE
jgi:hypothetical protein